MMSSVSTIVLWWVICTLIIFAIGVVGLRVGWEVIKGALFVAFCVAVIMIAGCAETRTADEIAYERQLDRENWELCSAVLSKHGRTIYHMDHPIQGRHKWYDIRSDLLTNDCRYILGPYYATSGG